MDGKAKTELEQLDQGAAFPSFSAQQCNPTYPSSAAQHSPGHFLGAVILSTQEFTQRNVNSNVWLYVIKLKQEMLQKARAALSR